MGTVCGGLQRSKKKTALTGGGSNGRASGRREGCGLPARAATTTTTTVGGTGFGFVDADAAAHPLDVLQIINGFGFVGGVGQINEGETALATGFTVERQGAFAHLSILLEEGLKVLHFGIEGEVANENGHEMNSERIKPIRGRP
jgi:hypothetical protein